MVRIVQSTWSVGIFHKVKKDEKKDNCTGKPKEFDKKLYKHTLTNLLKIFTLYVKIAKLQNPMRRCVKEG